MRQFDYTEAETAIHWVKGKAVYVPVKRETVVYVLGLGKHQVTRPYHPSKYPASRYSKTKFARRPE